MKTIFWVVQNCVEFEFQDFLHSHNSVSYIYLLYLLQSTRAAIGQFSGPYSSVRPDKSKTLFLRALFQDK